MAQKQPTPKRKSLVEQALLDMKQLKKVVTAEIQQDLAESFAPRIHGLLSSKLAEELDDDDEAADISMEDDGFEDDDFGSDEPIEDEDVFESDEAFDDDGEFEDDDFGSDESFDDEVGDESFDDDDFGSDESLDGDVEDDDLTEDWSESDEPEEEMEESRSTVALRRENRELKKVVENLSSAIRKVSLVTSQKQLYNEITAKFKTLSLVEKKQVINVLNGTKSVSEAKQMASRIVKVITEHRRAASAPKKSPQPKQKKSFTETTTKRQVASAPTKGFSRPKPQQNSLQEAKMRRSQELAGLIDELED